MKIYIKPSTETVDPELTRDISQGATPSVGNEDYDAKGTNKWETEEYDDSGFGW